VSDTVSAVSVEPPGGEGSRSGFLPRAEVYRLFTLIWKNLPGAQEARAALINGNLATVRKYILSLPTRYWYDAEDATQEAYLVLAESLDLVPAYKPRPDSYLYGIVRMRLREAFRSVREVEQMDAILPHTRQYTLHDVLTAASNPESSLTSAQVQTLHEALYQLSFNEQQALLSYFELLAFQPQSRRRYVKKCSVGSREAQEALRHNAYRQLRKDAALREAIFGGKAVQA